MIVDTLIYRVSLCTVCGNIILWKPAVQNKPDICPRCRFGNDVITIDSSKNSDNLQKGV